MTTQFIKVGYNITTDPQFQNKRYGIPPALEKQLQSLAIECQKKSTSKLVDKLNQLIIQYPTVPQLKNYLSVTFHVQGNKKKAEEVNQWTLSEHPDYLFARLNAANVYIERSELEKVPEVLGEMLEIKSLYPERDLFHLAEVTGYLKVVIRYLAAMENVELAENRLELLTGIAPCHPDTEQAEIFLWPLRLKLAGQRMEEETKNRITPAAIKVVPELSNDTPPQFKHVEIQNLYQYGLYIPHEKLKEIIALPRHTLIADLETVLLDAVTRYGYFKSQENTEETNSFVLHAFFLLAEIRAEESLPKLLSFLECDNDFLNYWFGDHITGTLWQSIFGLGFSNTTLLRKFLMQPGVDTYSKSCTSAALCQMVLHHPEKRAEVLHVYMETLARFAIATDDDDIIDSDFLGLTIADTLDCKLHELKPVIKTLFELGYVSTGICGNYKDVEKAFGREEKFSHKRDVYNIFDLYDHITTTWAGYTEEDGDSDGYDDYLPTFNQQPIISDKTGRNDPCPCGSGKKYKKCCMDKNQ
ncbi:MAG: DUF1186 domain-containing protein [Bacteroidota bacterium]